MQEYEYYYEGAEFYCYPETKVLINKFGIRDEDKLDDIEKRVTGVKLLDFPEVSINPTFDFDYYCQIHQYLFSEIYEWAGRPRKEGFMTKGSTIFARAEFIESMFSDCYDKLKIENFLKSLDKPKFCERLAYYMDEVNSIHPFREGNGRTSRVYFAELARNAGFDLEFAAVSKDDFILAIILSYNGKPQLLIEVLEKITTPLD